MNQQFKSSPIEVAQTSFLSKVYGWMSAALVITGILAYIIGTTPELVYTIASNQILFFGLLIGEIALVGYLSRAINKLSLSNAIAMFVLYAALNGVTLSIIFLAYTSASIASTFFVTAGTFGAMSLYGYTTKSDLSSMKNIAFMGIIGIIIASIANFFMQSEMLYWIITYVGVFIFIGLVAYDTQKLKQLQVEHLEDDMQQKVAVLGALTLYLDFINLFLFLLRIFGRRK